MGITLSGPHGRGGRQRHRNVVLASVLVGAGLVAAGNGTATASSPFTLLAAVTHDQVEAVAPPAAPGTGIHQSVAGTDTVTGVQAFSFGPRNTTPVVPVTDPAITVHSGWSTSDFPGLADPRSPAPRT